MILTHLEPLDKGGSFSMSRKIFHKSLHNSCPFFQIAAGGGVGYNSGTREALILVFNKTVKNRFIRLLFQQPAALPQKNVSPYISRRYRRPAKNSQDKMVLTILSRNSMIKSARAVSERFFVQSRYRKRRNTLCISRFRYRRVGEKDPLTVADDLVRGFL